MPDAPVKSFQATCPTPGAHFSKLPKLMVEHDISTVVVVDENGLFIGIVSERDITRRRAAAGLQPSQNYQS